MVTASAGQALNIHTVKVTGLAVRGPGAWLAGGVSILVEARKAGTYQSSQYRYWSGDAERALEAA